MDDETTAELVALARGGSQEAWNALVRRFASLVLAISRRYRLSPSDVEDVYQTVWLKLAENLDAIREPERLAGWLAATTRNAALRVARRPNASALEEHAPGDESVEDSVVDAARLVALLECLDRIKEGCRRLLRYIFLDGLSYAKIAKLLDMAVGSIGPTRQRCLTELRGEIGDWLGDD